MYHIIVIVDHLYCKSLAGALGIRSIVLFSDTDLRNLCYLVVALQSRYNDSVLRSLWSALIEGF